MADLNKEKILVTYAGRQGSTREVAQAIGNILRGHGLGVDVSPVHKVTDLNRYCGVIIGSAVRMGQLLPEIVHFAGQHRVALQQIPTAYFVVCLTMREDSPANRKQAVDYLKPLTEIKEPMGIGLFAGKIDYSKVSLPWRLLLLFDKSGALREGDWRDWTSIGEWANSIASALTKAQPQDVPALDSAVSF